MIRFIFVLLIFTSPQLFSQTAEQITSMGITSEDDILKELQKRGMTVEDAQRMALIYGIDYNEYISQYITSNNVASNATLPVVSELVVLGDSIQEILEDSIAFSGVKVL